MSDERTRYILCNVALKKASTWLMTSDPAVSFLVHFSWKIRLFVYLDYIVYLHTSTYNQCKFESNFFEYFEYFYSNDIIIITLWVAVLDCVSPLWGWLQRTNKARVLQTEPIHPEPALAGVHICACQNTYLSFACIRKEFCLHLILS